MPTDVAARRAELLRWYRRAHRDLPWRRTTDPYRIWVSEIMLQQTRVETVLGYYERFLDRFPDVAALAAAPLDAVLAAWSGLGYYRRARFLKAAAEQLVRDHAGAFPRDVAAAEALPGIGRSTAGAIVSIAFGTRAPVLDGNVKRVLARRMAWEEADGAALDRRCWPAAQELVDCADAGDVNQALMELGATVCLPFAAARCDACPWRSSCVARANGRVAALPAIRPRAELRAETWGVAVVRRGAALLVRRRPPTGLLHDLFELPTFEIDRGAIGSAACREPLANALAAATGLQATVDRELLVHRQVISNRKVTMRVFAATVGTAERPRPPARFVAPEELDALAITMATRKIARQLGASPPSAAPAAGSSTMRSARAARATAAASSRMNPKKR